MKRILCFAIAFVCVTLTFAQTGLEIVNNMNRMMSDRKSEGLCVTIDVKIPIVGTVVTRTYSNGSKTRLEIESSKINLITFMEDSTQWSYNAENNVVIITNLKIGGSPSETQGMDVSMFDDITEGYDISVKSQNAVKWELVCKKKRSNKDDDAPKTINLEVRKGTFEPISMSTKMMGINCTMHDFKFGISEKEVTFNEADFPGVTIVDNRQP